MSSILQEKLAITEVKPHPLKGIFIYLICSFLNVFSRIMSKQAIVKSPQGVVSTFHILTVRSIGVITLNFIMSWAFLKVDFLNLKSYKWLIFKRSIFAFLISLFIFLAINYLPYSQAEVICNIAPVITMFYAAYFLQEKVTLIEVACLIFCIAGLIIYSNPGGIISTVDRSGDFKNGQNPSSIIGILLCLCTAFMTAYVPILNKLLTQIHPTLISSFQMVPGMILAPVFMFYYDSRSQSSVTLSSLMYLFIGAMSFSVGSQLLNWSFHFQKASRLMLFKFLQIVYSIIFDLFLFGSTLRWTDYLGASLITVSVILISFLKCLGSVK